MPLDLLPRLLYRDAMMLVIDKPAGIPVHKGSGGGENLEQHFEQLCFGLPRIPALAHRLDKDTSGCLVLGRHRQALATLGKLFEHNKIEKTYWAIVGGIPKDPVGTINFPLAKKTTKSHHWHMKVDPKNGAPSLTEYRLLGHTDTMSWLALKPRTGRTHQLRVHCAAIGCPIMGDGIYGTASNVSLHLHAESLRIPFYPKKAPIEVSAPPPEHMLEALIACGYQSKI